MENYPQLRINPKIVNEKWMVYDPDSAKTKPVSVYDALSHDNNLVTLSVGYFPLFLDNENDIATLICRRCPDKEQSPNKWSFASAGAIDEKDLVTNSDYINFHKAIIREAEEEISIKPTNIMPIVAFDFPNEYKNESARKKLFLGIDIVEDPKIFDAIKLDKDELCEHKIVKISELIGEIQSEKEAVSNFSSSFKSVLLRLSGVLLSF